ncbi:MAG: YggS family pyridoxal phosphate-dependent enzyme [Firmicutes bacterium]|nr:YggS family pyridoxal phosphate-dependent enzyme [Bacillota bacterium]
MSIAENVKLVKENIEAAAIRCGRDPKDIKLVAATKMNDAFRVREAIAAGVDICGENRVQELQEKLAQGAYDGCPLHFIGHLQKNKVKYIIGKVELIHSVDSVSLAQEINKRAAALGLTQDILLEVNIGAEENKSGFAPEELACALDEMAQFSSIRVLGLMAIPPVCEISENNRVYFRRMKQLFIDIGQKKYDNVIMQLLSMGMSADYEVAVEEGANLVRVGTGIFGARNYALK